MSVSSDSGLKEALGSSLSQPLLRVEVCGDDNQYVILGGRRYLRSELQQAFGGTFQVERYLTGPTHSFGNPAPLGLAGFGLSSVTLGLIMVGVKGIHVNQITIGMAMFCGALLLTLAGYWEMVMGNTFGALSFISYGAFWFAFGCVQLPAFGIAQAYGTDHAQLGNALGFFMLGWVIFTFMMWSFTLKATWAFFAMCTTLLLTFIMLAAMAFTGLPKVTKAAGSFSIITGIVGWACGFAGVATKQNSYFTVPTRLMPIIGKRS